MKDSAFWRYTAFQVPGWILASVGGWWIYRTMNVPLWVASGVLVVWVIKDYALYPFLRFAYEPNHLLPIERLIGELGTAVRPLAPNGYVRVRGELWRATAEASVVAGDEIEVTSVDGMTLVVKPTVDRSLMISAED